MLCVKSRLPTKQNADSRKTTCFKCFTETPCFTQASRKIMFLLRPSILAAAMLSCTHLHFISSYVLSLLYMFETPKSFQLRPWPQICTPILTAATLYCMHLHFISPMSCLCFEGLRNPNSSGRGGRRNTPTAVKFEWQKMAKRKASPTARHYSASRLGFTLRHVRWSRTSRPPLQWSSSVA